MPKYTHKIWRHYPHRPKFRKIFLHTIIITSRREIIKTTKKILENYEYTGHSLDTITPKSSRANIISNRHFIVSILHTCGHYIHTKPPLFLDTTFIVTFYFFRAQYIGRVFRQCYNEIINHYAKETYQRKRRTNEGMGLGSQ